MTAMLETFTCPAQSRQVGTTFRAARRGTGLSIRTLAAEAGVSHTTISRWERGERDISLCAYEHVSLTLAHFMAGRWVA